MARHADEFRTAGCELLVVTQARPDVLRRFLERAPQPFPVVGDPGRLAYRAFGLERTSWLTFFHPGVIWRYLKLMIGGGRVRRPYDGEDVRQLGGDFLLDRGGETVWSFTSADPTVRPAVADVLRALPARP